MTRLTRRTTVLLAGILAGANLAGAAAEAGDPMHPRVKIETSLGDIILELDAEKAPITVLNFIRYAEDKYYDGTIFHRVMENFMIQGGGFTPDMAKKAEGLRSGIRNEWENGLKNKLGTIAMARLGRLPDSATSQFFINVVDNASLDKARDGAAYAVFGKVVEGMDVMNKIRTTEVSTHPRYGGGRASTVPVAPVVIKSVKLISEFDRTKAETAQKAAEDQAKAAKAAVVAAREKEKGEQAEKMIAHVKKLEDETGKKAVATGSGLQYIILKEGEGESPSPTSTVKVHYTGWLLDGSKFDSSVDRGEPATFALNGVIAGWTEGVGLMKVGAKWKLIIPPDMAYGSMGRPKIPANSTLVFDVELLSIER